MRPASEDRDQHYGETDAEVLAWTPGGAVLIRYTPEGERFATYVWLWANAVRRIGHDGLPS